MHNIKDIKNFFLISIETLHCCNFSTDYSNYTYKTYLAKKNNTTISLIKLNNILIDRKYFKKSKFIDNIHLAYFIYHKKYRNILQSMAYKILQNITDCNKPYLQLQYIQKFTYIYYKNYKYYNIYSYYNKPEIQKIAIKILYLITQLNSSHSIYLISKYINK